MSEGKLKSRVFYRDGLEEIIIGDVSVRTRPDGFMVEEYALEDGQKRFFVIKPGTGLCAHGDTEAAAVADAIWKDEETRPQLEKLRDEIVKAGKDRKISLGEFRVLTGACAVGCREAIKKAGHDGSPLTAFEIAEKINREWGEKVISILGWEKGR